MKKIFFKLILVTVNCLTLVLSSFAQPQNWNWYFGDSAAISFNSGTPVAVSGCQLNQLEGSTSISDASGNLLFYTDGVSVWNRNNIVMPNGTGLNGNYSTTQCLIVPKPDSSSIYYIFTAGVQGNSYGINFNEVDMAFNGGLGDVTVKNFQLVAPAAEKLCAVKHCNGIDYWVIAHGYQDSSYYSYQVTPTGVLVPVISNIGIYIGTNSYDAAGYLKASPNGKKLAAAIIQENIVQLFDFDNSTGVLSNSISITNVGVGPYGISFSPDNSKLYVQNMNGFRLYQYDISSNDQTTINSSQYLIVSSFIGGAMQLGPDNKLYLGKTNSYYLDAINNPNVSGSGCNYILNAVSLGANRCYWGLQNFIDAYAPSPPTPTSAFTVDTLSGCKPLVVHFTNNSTHATSYLWTFGNGDTSTLINPIRTYNNSTFDTVSLIAYYTTPCGVFTDTSIQVFDFIVFDPPQQPIITLSNDTLHSSSLINNQWYKDSALLSGDTNNYYQPTQNGSYTVEVTDTNGCTAMSAPYSFYVGINEVQNPFNSNPWLGNAYPNPFKDLTEIPYYLPTTSSSAEIDIFDLVGNKIESYPLYTKGIMTTLQLNSTNYSGGFYFCILVVDGNKVGWKKLVTIK